MREKSLHMAILFFFKILVVHWLPDDSKNLNIVRGGSMLNGISYQILVCFMRDNVPIHTYIGICVQNLVERFGGQWTQEDLC